TIFDGGIYGKPQANGQQFLLNYGLRNIFETKLYSKADSTSRNVKLLQRFDFSGSYNFAAEEYNWSRIRLSANTSLFNGITNIIFSASFDPYQENAEGDRIEKLMWDSRRVPVRFTNANMRVTTNLTSTKIRNIFKGKKEPETAEPNRNLKDDGFFSLFENFTVNHSFVINREKQGGVDTLQITSNTIYFSGRIDLTDKWRVTVGSFGYDFVAKGVTFPSLAVARDLHCWEMGISWQPSLNTYAFYLRVDPGTFLDFLNIPYRKGSQDPFFNQGSNFGGF
ncbi:MAG: hypothetical protein KDC34_11275, partial [Saprospiraceae bacterium]|nr:hypothetical protein [Saprospiraceae bacterium]